MFVRPLLCWLGLHRWSVRLMPTYPGCELQSTCVICGAHGEVRK